MKLAFFYVRIIKKRGGKNWWLFGFMSPSLKVKKEEREKKSRWFKLILNTWFKIAQFNKHGEIAMHRRSDIFITNNDAPIWTSTMHIYIQVASQCEFQIPSQFLFFFFLIWNSYSIDRNGCGFLVRNCTQPIEFLWLMEL